VPMEQIGERMLEMRKSRADFVKIVGVNNT
jgi:hypothetical protein